MKKKLKYIAIGILTAFVVVCALPLLIYVPPIQQWLVQKVAVIASEQTGMQITVEHVDLDFPLDLGIDGVLVRQDGDTIAQIGRAVVDVQLLPLLSSEVVVDELSIEDACVNTLDMISDIQVRGCMGSLRVQPSTLHLQSSTLHLSNAALADADITIQLTDTAAVDTTDTAPSIWRIDFGQLDIRRSNVSIQTDSMQIGIGAALMQANNGDIDLAEGRYTLRELLWQEGALAYELPYEPRTAKGLDYSHLNLTDINLAIDSFRFQSPITQLTVREAACKEQSGLEITQLTGALTIDSTGIKLPGATLRTPYSNIYARADIDFNVADDVQPGQMDVDLDAQVGKQDIGLLTDFDTRHLPEWPLALKGQVRGNLQQASVNIERLSWPTVIEAEASGNVGNLTDFDHLLAQLDLRAKSYNLKPLFAAFDIPQSSFSIPSGLSLEGNIGANGTRYTADLTARVQNGYAKAKGFFDQKSMTYSADVDIHQINLRHFVPDLPLSTLSCDFNIKGRGTDFFTSGAELNLDGAIHQLGYEETELKDIKLQANLKNGHALIDLMSCNKFVEGNINIDATLTKGNGQESLSSTLAAELTKLDLQAMGIIDNPLLVGFSGDFELDTNLDDTHRLSGLLDHIYLRDSANVYQPEKVGILLRTNADTTYARAQSGSLIIKLDASGGYEPFFGQCMALKDSIASQLSQHIITQPTLKEMLPNARLYISSGRNNPVVNFMKATSNIEFKELLLNVTSSPTEGVNGQASMQGLDIDSTRIDSIFITLKDKPNHGLTFQGRVANNRKNPQFVFRATADGLLQEHGASIGVRFYDEDDQLGLRLGAKAEMEDDGIRFNLLPANPTIGYQEFTLNDDNYLFLHNNQRLQAKVSMQAKDGMGIIIFSEDVDTTLLQDLTISLHKFDLDKLTSALPFMPHITGVLNGDFHLTMDAKKQISVASDMQVRQLTYEGSPMGDLSTEFVYLQREDDTHAVEGTLMQNGREIAYVSGNYKNKKVTDGNEHLDATLTMTKTPLNLINGFIPDKIVGLEGFAEGEMTIEGSLSRPDVNGEIFLDSAYLISLPYGVRLRFDNDPVRIQKSKLLLENFTMYAYNDNPLNIMGNIDFHDMDHMTMDIRMRATNYQIINARQEVGSIAYGKGFVNFLATMRGPLDRLRMRGKLDVLGTTDITYLLLDSPLSTDNQLDELVKFTDFSDTTQIIVHRPTPDGLDMDLSISIDQGAHVKCGLNVDQTNYVDLYGGGDLRMIYNSSDNLRLTGRYTLSSGQMKYSLPVIPLKTFTIQDGSYVEFTGDAMNPQLNITATERTTASVGDQGEATRSVNFECGVVITKTLNDMGLQFTISALDDYNISSELNAMSVEQRGKLAVTMLTTGMYTANGNTSGLMNAALSSFLEHEINNITGSALKTVDLDIGLENATDATGKTHTNYSFKFAKRFWNNRLKVQIGGKVSSGNDIQGREQSFFDNVSIEYRLSPTSNQYVSLFYNQNAYDWLDGYTSEYGGGFIWKRKLNSLLDIFKLSSKTEQPMAPRRRPTEPRDSTKTLRNDTIR